ncbi:MAG: hypothetical protein R3361_05985, partial [Aequorivita vladivostokensis]|nr:hypothetical protein [Aequorivita vladivostokensis]
RIEKLEQELNERRDNALNELAKEAGAEDDNPFNNKTSKTEIPQFIISENFAEYSFASADELISVENIGYKPNLNSSLYISKILHPPQLG